MEEKVHTFLKQHIKKNSKIVLAVSGGGDSVYLLHQCLAVQAEHPFEVIVVHLNHKLRKKESDQDANFIKKLAQSLQLPYYQETIKKLPKGNLEEVCRIKRYEFFEHVRQKTGADWILTAHHQNDNIETVLFHFVRGSFLGGLQGMEAVSVKRHLLRPLLSTPKTNILQYLTKHHIAFCEDSSNHNLQFSRNIIRKKIIPELQTINPGLEETISRNIANIQEVNEYLEKITQQWLNKNRHNQKIPLTAFLSLENIIQKNILFFLYKELYGHTTQFHLNHLEQILNVLRQKKSNRKKEFGKRYFLKIIREQKDQYLTILANTPANKGIRPALLDKKRKKATIGKLS